MRVSTHTSTADSNRFRKKTARLPAVFDYSRSISAGDFVMISGNLLRGERCCSRCISCRTKKKESLATSLSVRFEILFQVCTSAIEIFHQVHHYVNKLAREKDDTIPTLPEQRNPIFFVYPLCMLLSLVLGILWLVKKILADRPVIVSLWFESCLRRCKANHWKCFWLNQ